MRSKTDDPKTQKAYEQVLAQLISVRRKQHVSQSELARAMGIKPSYVSKIETKEIVPKLDRVAQMADILGCELKVRYKRRDAYRIDTEYTEQVNTQENAPEN